MVSCDTWLEQSNESRKAVGSGHHQLAQCGHPRRVMQAAPQIFELLAHRVVILHRGVLTRHSQVAQAGVAASDRCERSGESHQVSPCTLDVLDCDTVIRGREARRGAQGSKGPVQCGGGIGVGGVGSSRQYGIERVVGQQLLTCITRQTSYEHQCLH